jgi:hypothetical protein
MSPDRFESVWGQNLMDGFIANYRRLMIPRWARDERRRSLDHLVGGHEEVYPGSLDQVLWRP